MDGKLLETVGSHPYLGVELSHNLNWNQHVTNITAKANRALGSVKRNLNRFPEQVKEQAFKTLVRPHLEYASTVWSPHQKYQVKDREVVQRKVACFCKNCLDRDPGMVTCLLQKLTELGDSSIQKRKG